ncbi:MAG: NADH-quinone oxidoreductase subunit N [Candidatus Bathyanammoxibius sp.]
MEITLPLVNLNTILPQLIVAVFAMAALLADAFYRNALYAFVLSLLGLALALFTVYTQWGVAFPYQESMLTINGFTVFFNSIFILVAAVTILLSLGYAELTGIDGGKYYPLILLATLGMMLLVSCRDLLLMFLAIELLSISSYVLVASQGTKWVSGEAAVKYMLTGAFASSFLLFGIALVFGATGTTDFVKIGQVISGGGAAVYLGVGIAMMMVGLGFKIAMVPFHMWAPDVYEGAPTPISGFLSAGSKVAVFALLLRLFVGPFSVPHVDWVSVIWWLAVLSMVVGNVSALLQTNVKRMLAYSSIAHVGYMLIALVVLDGMAMEAILLYLAVYATTGLAAFGCVTYLSKGSEERLNIRDYTAVAYNYPIQSAVLSVCLLSLAGIPLTAGFIGKLYLFGAAVNAGFVSLAVIGVLNSAVSLYYYLGLLLRMYSMPNGTGEVVVTHPMAGRLVLALLGVTILVLGIYPSPLLVVIKAAVAAIMSPVM